MIRFYLFEAIIRIRILLKHHIIYIRCVSDHPILQKCLLIDPLIVLVLNYFLYPSLVIHFAISILGLVCLIVHQFYWRIILQDWFEVVDAHIRYYWWIICLVVRFNRLVVRIRYKLWVFLHGLYFLLGHFEFNSLERVGQQIELSIMKPL